MEVLYRSTRGNGSTVTASNAILKGLSEDGGLFVPDQIPVLDVPMEQLAQMSYQEVAYEVMSRFLTDFTEEELKKCIQSAYDKKFDTDVIAPLVKADGAYYLELFHGSTIAFKDMALSILPYLLTTAAKKNGVTNDIVILTATSGDTGKAALQGFSNVDGFKVVVYYPENGVSAIQEKQMVTQEGNNVKVIGIRGNFDNAQSGVKKIFGDVEFREELKNRGFLLSSANSINIGRLVPQIVYYFYGYFDLVNKQKIKEGDEINIVVPTGNFGNILAAYYGKKMGLPIGKLICSSNENNVLTDFLNTGLYDRRRELILTESPSMDILVSSNLERLIFEANNRDAKKTKKLMDELNEKGVYSISSESKAFLSDFYGNYANTDEVYEAIKNVYNNKKYLMDTHTAVGYVVFNKYRKETGDNRQALIASTASPYKFPRSICNALELDVSNKDDFEILKLLNEYTNIEIPKNLVGLNNKKILHNNVCDKEKMKDILKESKND